MNLESGKENLPTSCHPSLPPGEGYLPFGRISAMDTHVLRGCKKPWDSNFLWDLLFLSSEGSGGSRASPTFGSGEASGGSSTPWLTSPVPAGAPPPRQRPALRDEGSGGGLLQFPDAEGVWRGTTQRVVPGTPEPRTWSISISGMTRHSRFWVKNPAVVRRSRRRTRSLRNSSSSSSSRPRALTRMIVSKG